MWATNMSSIGLSRRIDTLRPVRSSFSFLMLAALLYTCCLCPGVALAQSNAGTHTNLLLSVSPIPKAGSPSLGTPEVTWSTGNGSPGIVTVSLDGGKEMFFAWGNEASALAPWISANHTYVFRLYSIAYGRRLLARLRVDQTASLQVVAQAPAPRSTSPIENRLLQILSFASIAFLFCLALMHVREARNLA